MRTQSIDTDPQAEQFLIRLLRQKDTAQKFSQVRSLSRSAIRLSKRALMRANKELNNTQIDNLFIAYHYSEELANRVRTYMERKHDE